MDIEERLCCAGFEGTVFFPDFGEECIVGIDTNGKIIYSYEKMIESLMQDGIDDIEAIEWIEYNTIRSIPYIDNQTNNMAPIIMYSCDWLGI